jgi:hypothetical protein
MSQRDDAIPIRHMLEHAKEAPERVLADLG